MSNVEELPVFCCHVICFRRTSMRNDLSEIQESCLANRTVSCMRVILARWLLCRWHRHALVCLCVLYFPARCASGDMPFISFSALLMCECSIRIFLLLLIWDSYCNLIVVNILESYYFVHFFFLPSSFVVLWRIRLLRLYAVFYFLSRLVVSSCFLIVIWM